MIGYAKCNARHASPAAISPITEMPDKALNAMRAAMAKSTTAMTANMRNSYPARYRLNSPLMAGRTDRPPPKEQP